MNGDKLILALPSKGRLMEDAAAVFARAGLAVQQSGSALAGQSGSALGDQSGSALGNKSGSARGYQGVIATLPQVEVVFVASSEIAGRLRSGAVHLGVTGADLVAEANGWDRVTSLAELGFGPADVVVAVPDCWLDVNRMADLELMAMTFRRRTGRRVRVATKYLNLTRAAFAARGVVSYRIVESLGATEGAPAAGLAELIVDITTTGATLRANGLRVLDDGVLLRSQANLWASHQAVWSSDLERVRNAIGARISAAVGSQ